MAPFVLDTSVAVSWCFAGESSAGTDSIFDALELAGAEVPALFFYELQNVLRRGERQGKTSPEGIQAFWVRMLLTDIRVENLDVMPVQPWLIQLARQYSLSAYDAAYLDLAQRRGLPLATKDTSLRAAAVQAGIVPLPADLL